MSRSAIEAVVEKLESAWEAADGEAWGACFSEDCDFCTWFGHRFSGRTENADMHQQIFDSHYLDTKVHFELDHLRFATDDLAFAHLRGWVRPAGEPKPGGQPEVLPLAVFRNIEGRWLIEAFQNTPRFDKPPAAGKVSEFIAANS